MLRTHVPPQLVLDDWLRPKPAAPLPPDPQAIAEAVEVLWSAKRPLVVTGRGARGAGARARPPPRRSRRALSRHPGEPRPGPGRPSVGRRRDARRGDDRGRRRAGDRTQARLPARLRLAGGVPERALRPDRRHRGRARSTTAGARRSSWPRPRWRSPPWSSSAATASRRDRRRVGREPRAGATSSAPPRRRGRQPHDAATTARSIPAAIFEAIRAGGRPGLHRHCRRRRPPELRPGRARGAHLPGCRRVRLPRRRRAVRGRRGAGLSGAAR